jgi:hypothetical protein
MHTIGLLPGGSSTDVAKWSRRGKAMDVLIARCCRLDVHKDTVVALCGRRGREGEETRRRAPSGR